MKKRIIFPVLSLNTLHIRVYNKEFMLNSLTMRLILLINFKMLTIVDSLTFNEMDKLALMI